MFLLKVSIERSCSSRGNVDVGMKVNIKFAFLHNLRCLQDVSHVLEDLKYSQSCGMICITSLDSASLLAILSTGTESRCIHQCWRWFDRKGPFGFLLPDICFQNVLEQLVGRLQTLRHEDIVEHQWEHTQIRLLFLP